MKNNSLLTKGALYLFILSAGFLLSCKDDDNPAGHTENVTVISDTTTVFKLGITTRPITDSLARAIAETASTGKTISSAQKTEDTIIYYDVQLQVGVIVEDFNFGHASGEHIEDIPDGYAKVADARLAGALPR